MRLEEQIQGMYHQREEVMSMDEGRGGMDPGDQG